MTVPQTAAPTLAAFLLERLSEDEAVARACAEMFPPPWEVADRGWRVRIYSADVPDEGDHAEPGDMLTPCPMEVEPTRHHRLYGDTRWLSERVEHIARHDPARVLADIAAKRRIVELHPQRPTDDDPTKFGCPTCDYDMDCSWQHESTDPGGCPTLRALAAPYRDAPGWREEWR